MEAKQSAGIAGEHSNTKRRTRTAFTSHQLMLLENVFLQTHYPDICIRENLARSMSLTESKIQVCLQEFNFTSNTGRTPQIISPGIIS